MEYSSTFFEISAQLIPVLFLALIVDENLQPDAEEEAVDRIARSWAAASLVIGEVLSLSVVAGGLLGGSGVGSLVAATMLLAALLIALPVFSREMRPKHPLWERLVHAAAGLTVLVAVLGSIIWININ